MAPTPSFSDNTPSVDKGNFQPFAQNANFAGRPGSSPMYSRFSSKGFIVKGPFGTGITQEELRQQYRSGDDNQRLLMYCAPIKIDQSGKLTEWETLWRAEAESHVKSFMTGKKAGKLAYSPLVRDDGSVKINVPVDVAEFAKGETDVDDIFEMGNAQYDVVFRVSGVWRNNTSYGLCLSALRLRRVKKLGAGIKRKAPTDFEFGIPDGFDSEGEATDE